MIVYMSNVHAVIYIAWHCQHFYLHYTAVFRNRSVIIPNDFMLSIVCFWFSFLMGWLRARQRIRTALGSSRNTFGSSLCSSKNSDCCMNAVWKWPLTWRRDQLRLEKTFADSPQKKKNKQTFFQLLLYNYCRTMFFLYVWFDNEKKKCNFNRDLPRLCVQLVPYAGEELVSVRVEPCSPAVIQERNEVLEVGFCNVLVASGNHQQWPWPFFGGVKLK